MSAFGPHGIDTVKMGKRKEEQSIYVDSKNLRKLVRRSVFAMQKCDRAVYGTPLMEDTKRVIADFVMAYDFAEEKKYYMRKLCADFAVLKVDLEDIIEDNVIKNADKQHLHMSPEALRTEIYKCIANIDEGIAKWRNSPKGQD